MTPHNWPVGSPPTIVYISDLFLNLLASLFLNLLVEVGVACVNRRTSDPVKHAQMGSKDPLAMHGNSSHFHTHHLLCAYISFPSPFAGLTLPVSYNLFNQLYKQGNSKHFLFFQKLKNAVNRGHYIMHATLKGITCTSLGPKQDELISSYLNFSSLKVVFPLICKICLALYRATPIWLSSIFSKFWKFVRPKYCVVRWDV